MHPQGINDAKELNIFRTLVNDIFFARTRRSAMIPRQQSYAAIQSIEMIRLTGGKTADGHENEATGENIASVLSGDTMNLGENLADIGVEEEQSKEVTEL